MNKRIFPWALIAVLGFVSCSDDDDNNGGVVTPDVMVSFSARNTITVNGGGEGFSEIAAFDPTTNKIFVTNGEEDAVEIYDISDVDNPVQETKIDLSATGGPNSVSVHNGMLAIAVEGTSAQDAGNIWVYDTSDTAIAPTSYTVGALPDMVTFTPDGSMIVVANEGEPNDDYTVDPKGTVSIIELGNSNVTTLNFDSFIGDEATLEAEGFRVFGPNADLSEDVEPEYVAVSDDSQTAWVSLQENNGIARVNLATKMIEAIYPLGFKDYSLPGNEIDPSDKDMKSELRSVPVFGMYQPDAIKYVNIGGTGYIVSANEGDAREYEGNPGFVGEDRVKDVTLDPTVFPDAATLQEDENIGRLKLTTTLGDTDSDGDFDEIYSYGARSFSLWSESGSLVYDSGNEIAARTLELTPTRFNGFDVGDNEDARSDDKGAEPEAVETVVMGNKTILFVGLERNDQVLVYDISNPTSPEFIQILSNTGDEAPEGVLAIAADDSPTGKTLLVVSNEDTGTITIYENIE